MATNFGMSELRSKFHNWRTGRKDGVRGTEYLADVDLTAGLKSSSSLQPPNSHAEPHICSIVEDSQGAFDLSVLLENLVIPKLMADRDNPANRVSERGLAETVGTNRKRPITVDDVETFTSMTTCSEASTLLDFVDNCLATGSSVEAIYIDLLAPAARRLGEYWEKDTGDFVDVTMGLWRIQEILRELALRVPPPISSGIPQRSALFSTMPGEQHSLGTLMVAECFQRAGWDTDVLMEPTQSELTGKFANRHYDMIGLTLSNDCPSGVLSDLIHTIRSVSSNPGICVMIGGRFVNENPHIADECGADGTAADAQNAVLMANEFVAAKAASSALLA
ncbi:cobalamin B12-binding domain-containing protein [Pontixanthobacter sp.]|uniref:cobalamin B12-binding domain-containing protein n=1 Tax=Pontixanthobacter sp. TaxID=2792078 RepID=UPI003C7B1E98